MEQIANSFDIVTVKKIGKGALIAGGGALAVYVLQYLSVLDYAGYTPLVTALCAIAINAIKEYLKGI